MEQGNSENLKDKKKSKYNDRKTGMFMAPSE